MDRCLESTERFDRITKLASGGVCVSLSERAKRLAANKAVEFLRSGMIVGLGSGSTAEYAVREIGRKTRSDELSIIGIPTSKKTEEIALQEGIVLSDLNAHPLPDVAIDGADQVDKELRMIKGMGAALTREKVVDSAARRLIIVVDESKLTERLGLNQVVPVEVLPFALEYVKMRIIEMRGISILRRGKEGNVLTTDNGNQILDVDLGEIRDPNRLEAALKMIPGVIECGLFLDMADLVCVGRAEEVTLLERR